MQFAAGSNESSHRLSSCMSRSAEPWSGVLQTLLQCLVESTCYCRERGVSCQPPRRTVRKFHYRNSFMSIPILRASDMNYAASQVRWSSTARSFESMAVFCDVLYLVRLPALGNVLFEDQVCFCKAFHFSWLIGTWE